MIKLTHVAFTGTRYIGATRLESFEIDRPPNPLKDWRIALRGQTVLMISPAGWLHNHPARRDAKEPRVVLEFPRSEVMLRWECAAEHDADAVAKGITKYESQPFGWQPRPIEPEKSLLAQVPPHQVGD
jgi:hypothetical protein